MIKLYPPTAHWGRLVMGCGVGHKNTWLFGMFGCAGGRERVWAVAPLCVRKSRGAVWYRYLRYASVSGNASANTNSWVGEDGATVFKVVGIARLNTSDVPVKVRHNECSVLPLAGTPQNAKRMRDQLVLRREPRLCRYPSVRI